MFISFFLVIYLLVINKAGLGWWGSFGVLCFILTLNKIMR
jgi:hypothetical protein